MERDQIELHRTIRSKLPFKERREPNSELLSVQRRVDELIVNVPDETLREQIKHYLFWERQHFPLFLPAPQWLVELAEGLQVIHGDSPGDDPNANAVHAIRLILGREITPAKKLTAISKIIGDVRVEE